MIGDTLTEIVGELRTVLEDTAPGVSVTADPHEASSAVAAGGTVVLVLAAPAIEWATWQQFTATWTAWAITGATSHPIDALEAFEPILENLAAVTGLESARPQTYTLGDREQPGYELTFTTEHA